MPHLDGNSLYRYSSYRIAALSPVMIKVSFIGISSNISRHILPIPRSFKKKEVARVAAFHWYWSSRATFTQTFARRAIHKEEL